MRTRFTTTWAAAALAAVLCCGAGQANETEEQLEAPGYRPGSGSAAAFVARLPAANIAVFPPIVRTVKGTTHDEATVQRMVAFIDSNKLGAGTAADLEFEPGKAEGVQWKLFQSSLKTIGGQLQEYHGDADFVLVTEYLLTPTRSGGMAAGGIECYILNRAGEDVFSFLLNSHHRPFVDAELKRPDRSEESRSWLVEACTRVALEAFKGQVDGARSEERGAGSEGGR